MGTFIIQPHGRLQEWVAEEHGFFRDEGLSYEFEPEGLAASSRTTSAVQTAASVPIDARSGAFEDMEVGRSCNVSAACHWAVNAAATNVRDKMWGKAYSVSPSGIFVAPDSPLQRPEELADVAVAVGYHSGSHYSAIQALEGFLERPAIKLAYAGLPNDRVRLLLRGEVPAANVFGAQYYILEQLGFRKLVDTTFIMGFLIKEDADTEDTERYFRGLRRAQQAIDLEPERYKDYWLRELLPDLAERVDVRRFGPGERIVFEPYTREMYEQTHRWMKSWDLLDLDLEADAGFDKAVLV